MHEVVTYTLQTTPLPIIHYKLHTTVYALPTTHYPLPTTDYKLLLLTIHYPPPTTIHYLLLPATDRTSPASGP